MYPPTEKLLKKFEQEHEIYLEARDQKSYWEVFAKMPKKIDSLHNAHRSKKYISGREQEGNVLIIQNPEVYGNYTIEQWGPMANFDEFVEKVLVALEEDVIEYESDCKPGDEVQAPTDIRAG
ncbi:MAG: hypothetical protein METHP_00715 [Methanoregula sp. SKADARSKE-2]|nr:MAG: hypothetical protein METHP_00715 [Methanoregula sp. SKADARSKE-2]